MSEKSTSPVPVPPMLRFVWQGVLMISLVAISWVLAQRLPGAGHPGPQAQSAAPAPAVRVASYSLPTVGSSAALAEINRQVAAAQKEVIVGARQLAATSLLTNLKERAQAGVSLTVLLSPDTLTNFPASRLFQWLRDNQLRGIYRDTLPSASHLIIIDSRTVILSDLPFSQKSLEAADSTAAAQASQGFLYIIEDPALAAKLSQELRQRAQPSNKIL